MTNLNHEQRIRELTLRIAVERELTGIPAGARDILVSQIAKVPAGRAHVLGTEKEPSAKELLDELWHSPVGRDLRELLDAQEGQVEPDSAEAQLAELNKLPPAQRLTEARKRGLKF